MLSWCNDTDPFNAWLVSALHLGDLLMLHTLHENVHEDLGQSKLSGC